jgi:ABC-type branched-subunit amino acid transport system substrate-binding protein
VGGKTLKFELVSEDDQCDAKAGVAVAQKFVDSGVRTSWARTARA